jgi:hypothetical protein
MNEYGGGGGGGLGGMPCLELGWGQYTALGFAKKKG